MTQCYFIARNPIRTGLESNQDLRDKGLENSVMKFKFDEGNNQRETCPNATLSPQIPHVLVWNLTRTFEIRGWKISALATARPLKNVTLPLNA